MAYIVTKSQSGTPCCKLDRADWGQLRDVLKLSRMKEKTSVRDWREFASMHPEAARLVQADVDTDNLGRKYTGKRIKKSKATIIKARKKKAKKAKKPKALKPSVFNHLGSRTGTVAKSRPKRPASALDKMNRTMARSPALRDCQMSIYDHDPARREFAWSLSQRYQ
jgi:hypothetical protein